MPEHLGAHRRWLYERLLELEREYENNPAAAKEVQELQLLRVGLCDQQFVRIVEPFVERLVADAGFKEPTIQ